MKAPHKTKHNPFMQIQSDSRTMYYTIFGEDIPNSLHKRLEARPNHIARLEALRDAGRLLLAGPHPAIDSENPGDAGFSGSLIVAKFESLAQAETWASQDPYVLNGVYQKIIVKPFKPVLP
jgi:uncharacterized protein